MFELKNCLFSDDLLSNLPASLTKHFVELGLVYLLALNNNHQVSFERYCPKNFEANFLTLKVISFTMFVRLAQCQKL